MPKKPNPNGDKKKEYREEVFKVKKPSRKGDY